jgi:hypothetical protein
LVFILHRPNTREKGGDFLQEFEKITISEISKNDMLMILEALEYTGIHSKVDDFIQLRDNIIKELSELAESSENDFMEYLKG